MKPVNEHPDIRGMADLIINSYHPDKIILFGSHATGNATPESDVDMMVISDAEKALPRYKRGLDVRVKLATYPIRKDILFYTHDEFREWLDIPQSLAAVINSEGVVLYERETA